MKNSKKRGIALLSSLILMVIVISTSGLLFALITSSTIKNKADKNRLEKFLNTQRIMSDFTDNGIIDDNYQFDIQVINNSISVATGTQAVVVKKLGVTDALDIYYYCVYDFDNQNILAEQSNNFYITTKNVSGIDYYFLADLVKYREV